jgi:Tfp pilus assembly protein PilV
VRRDGFTLVEVLVAMVVLELGLMGVVGTLLLAARTMRRAEVRERMVAEAARLYDSLTSAAVPGTGVEIGTVGRLRWSVEGNGDLDVEVVDPDDSVLFSLQGRTPSVTGP